VVEVGALGGARPRSEATTGSSGLRRESQLTFVLVLVESAGTLAIALSARALLRRVGRGARGLGAGVPASSAVAILPAAAPAFG